MKSPFPGMDPFIEGQDLWGDFHDNFVIEIQRTIQRQLPPEYVARVNARSFADTVDPVTDLVIKSRIGPDVEVQRLLRAARGETPQQSVTAVADPPTTRMRGMVEFEEREIYLDIYKRDPDQRLVTSVELLSPENKRRGSVGWAQYENKRLLFLNGLANLVEIDLLRKGRRHGVTADWPDSPYVIAVVRKETAPECDVRAAYTTRPLPRIAIPLERPDPDLAIALQPIVDTIYDLSRYATQIRYDRHLDPPLEAEEAALITATRPAQK
jgi:hypothetical protein